MLKFLNRKIAYGILLAMPGYAAFAQTEDLSDDFLNPTQIMLSEGLNVVTNTVINSGSDAEDADTDFFTVVVPENLQIDSIVLSRYEGPAVSFIGFSEGPVLPADPSAGTDEQAAFSTGALGFALIGEAIVGLDVRSFLANGDVTIDRVNDPLELLLADNPRFDPFSPLAPGSYAFVFQDTGPFEVIYELSFTTSVIPEPNTLVLMSLLPLAAAVKRRRRDAEW